MATITLKAGMVWKGAYDASVPYNKLDVVYNADKTQIAVCKQGGTGIPLTNSNYWEVSIDASGIIALLEDALAHGEIYTMKIGSVTTGATSSATIVNNHQTHETILNLVLEKGEKGDKGDKGDRGEKGDTTVIDPSTATAYTLYNQTGNHTDGAMTQDAVTKEFEKLDEVYARNDGYYESMGVGTATNLKGQNTVDAEFTYRKSGGNVEVQDGNAMIEAIKGNTIAWNQLVDTNTTQVTPVNGRKICTVIGGVKSIVTSDGSAISVSGGTDILFDLTLIYGSGNEPATVEQFEQDYFNWFGKPLTYEPYDAGSLRNTKVSAFKTVGFNLWDEQWEAGGISTSNGQNTASTSAIRSKNFIPVLHGLTYYYRGDSMLAIFGRMYDSQKNFIGYSAIGLIRKNTTFTIPTGCFYIRFVADGTTYNNDICINLSDPNHNGEYEPYKESTLPLDVTTLTGKLNGEGSSVVVFANGMNSAGNVHDEIKIENGVVKAIKRVGSVDLGTLDYVVQDNANVFKKDNFTPLKAAGASISSKYGYSVVGTLINAINGNDKTITINNTRSSFYVKDFDYSDATAFKAAMQGVTLYYELAEPEVYVLDDFSLPKLYPVANGGTEEQLSNSPNSLPATLSIRYGLNAAAFIQNAPKNYISKESMSNFLSNLGSAMGGTWTMTWNSSTNKYDFSFTQNRSVDVEQPIEDK